MVHSGFMGGGPTIEIHPPPLSSLEIHDVTREKKFCSGSLAEISVYTYATCGLQWILLASQQIGIIIRAGNRSRRWKSGGIALIDHESRGCSWDGGLN